MKLPSTYKMPGHRISYIHGSYWNAHYVCGWSTHGWYEQKTRAVREASSHMERMERKARALEK